MSICVIGRIFPCCLISASPNLQYLLLEFHGPTSLEPTPGLTFTGDHLTHLVLIFEYAMDGSALWKCFHPPYTLEMLELHQGMMCTDISQMYQTIITQIMHSNPDLDQLLITNIAFPIVSSSLDAFSVWPLMSPILSWHMLDSLHLFTELLIDNCLMCF